MRASYAAARTGRAPRPKVARGASIPAPVGGWDAYSPIAQMPPTSAVQLDNWFPQPDWVEVRRGHVVHASTRTNLPVETLATYNGVSSSKMFAVSNGSIFDVTSSGGSALVTGLVNSRFQNINFAGTGGNFLYMVNGADTPRYYDGTTWQTATITGTGIVPEDFINLNAHKNRLWFVINNSSDAAYLAVDSIQGAATKFPLGGLFTKGGYVMAMGTWSVDGGNGPDDYAVFVSSMGQVAIYSGTDPATDFSLVGVFDMGAPIGRRCLTRVGADIAIICLDGVVPLSRAMIFERAAVQKVSLTARIQRVMNDAARNYRDNFGWELVSYPRGTRAILNIPVEENTEQQQYVMNTLSGAWCRFIGMNANTWALLNELLYFGGNDGNVYLADTGGTDNGQTLHADMITAFNYFKSRGNQKRWTMCRPLLTTDQSVNPGLAFNVDFQLDAPVSTPSTSIIPGGQWDASRWDNAVWGGAISTQATWQSVAGLGYCASIRMVVDVGLRGALPNALWGESNWGQSLWGSIADNQITLQVNGFDLLMEDGAFV